MDDEFETIERDDERFLDVFVNALKTGKPTTEELIYMAYVGVTRLGYNKATGEVRFYHHAITDAQREQFVKNIEQKHTLH